MNRKLIRRPALEINGPVSVTRPFARWVRISVERRVYFTDGIDEIDAHRSGFIRKHVRSQVYKFILCGWQIIVYSGWLAYKTEKQSLPLLMKMQNIYLIKFIGERDHWCAAWI